MYKISKIKTLLCFFLCAVIAVCLSEICIGFTVKTGLTGKSSYKQSLVHGSYIEEKQKKILSEITLLIEENGLSEEITKEITAYDMVYIQILNSVDHVYSGVDEALEKEMINTSLSQVVNDYLQTNTITLTTDTEQTVGQVVEEAAGIYQDNMGIEDTKEFVENSNKVSAMVSKGTMLCIGAAFIALILLNALTKCNYQTIGYLAGSAGMACILNAVVLFLFLRAGLSEKLCKALASDSQRLAYSISTVGKEGIGIIILMALGMFFLIGLKKVIINRN